MGSHGDKKPMKYTAIVDGVRLDIDFDKTGPTSIEARIGGRSYVLEASTVEPGVYLPDFGVGAYCGLGRMPASEVPKVLEDHIQASRLL